MREKRVPSLVHVPPGKRQVKQGELTQMTAVGPCGLDGVLPHGNNGYEMEPNIENRTRKAVLRLSPESKGASTDQRGQQAAL